MSQRGAPRPLLEHATGRAVASRERATQSSLRLQEQSRGKDTALAKQLLTFSHAHSFALRSYWHHQIDPRPASPTPLLLMRSKSKLVVRGLPPCVTLAQVQAALFTPWSSLIGYFDYHPGKQRTLADACRMGTLWINFGPGVGWEAAMRQCIAAVQEGQVTFKDEQDKDVQPTVEWSDA